MDQYIGSPGLIIDASYYNSLDISSFAQELYRPGNSQEQFYNVLEKNMRPVYDSAKRQGYELWQL